MFRPKCASLMHYRRGRISMLATVSVAGLFAFALSPAQIDLLNLDFSISKAHAQDANVTEVLSGDTGSSPEQLLLESDELVYDNDRGVVIAQGNVQIAYGEYTLVASKVEYNQQSGRVLATGNVEIVEPTGNRIFAEEIDITDDFSDGFISALNVRTDEDATIAAESAERRDGEVTAFNNGVYSACISCQGNPDKTPSWQIRAKTVVINNGTRSVEYEDASFEFFGKTIMRLPKFRHAIPGTKRKTGFLMPTYSYSDDLGFGLRNSYFLNLAPNFDLTLSGTYYSRQGFLGEAEWRHRVENGQYNIRFAGIDQQDQAAFTAGSFDQANDQRGAITTQGRFEINSRWKFGWNALFQSDENFARTYELSDFEGRDISNEAYLTGLGEKNYFDLRGQRFLVQDKSVDFDASQPGNQDYSDQQATVLPLLDYNAVSGEEFGNGQVSLDINVASVSRGTTQVSNFVANGVQDSNERFTGIAGDTTRASALAEWKGSQILNGAVVTTSLSVQGDAISQDTDLNANLNPLTSNESIYRTMPAAMMEIRYPMIARDGMTTHIFEPIAQVIARPDEEDIGKFANEDSQSLVFDTSNLFKRDKYSGYDRVEGGTRANVGFRYSASFENGASLNVIAGQSFHLDGQNSFAQQDTVNAGLNSGLETDRSDYVASAQLNNGNGFKVGAGIRLDQNNFSLQQTEVGAQIVKPDYSFSGSYLFVNDQPEYRYDTTTGGNFSGERHEVRGAANFKVSEYWRAFGAIAYDLDTGDVISDSVGLAYHDDSFSFSASFSEERTDRTGEQRSQSIGFSIGFRTIGGYSSTHNLSGDNNN